MRFFNTRGRLGRREAQTLDYMAKSGAETGHLVMMDRRSKRTESTIEKVADGVEVWLL